MGKVYDLHYDVPDEDYKILKQRIEAENDEFWKQINYQLKRGHGGGVQDKHGHRGEVRVKLHPIVIDIVEGFRNEYPDWFDSNAQALRAIISIGLKFAMSMAIPRDGKKTRFEKSLARLKQIRYEVRQLGYLKEIEASRTSILSDPLIPNSKKVKKVAEIDEVIAELKAEIDEMF